MNNDVLRGKWKQLKGRVREEWGELTDDDVDRIQGNREQLEGRLQERYGYAKDEAREEVDDWLDRVMDDEEDEEYDF
ncbi:MAG: CsbD family protein [Chloroflexota bacterium]